MEKIFATWEIELNCICPSCNRYVDLLDAPDFWDGNNIVAGENNTPRSDNLHVICPKCDEEFVVECCLG